MIIDSDYQTSQLVRLGTVLSSADGSGQLPEPNRLARCGSTEQIGSCQKSFSRYECLCRTAEAIQTVGHQEMGHDLFGLPIRLQ